MYKTILSQPITKKVVLHILLPYFTYHPYINTQSADYKKVVLHILAP